jgi:hypothetical protein
MLTAEDFKTDTQEISGIKISITSYKIGERYHCHVANFDPGATISRGEGWSPDEAQQLALTKAIERLPKANH